LEAELDTRLFERTTRRVDLTEAGRLLVERATQILADVDSTVTAVAVVGRGAAGVLRIGFCGTSTYRLMPELVRLARHRPPNVRRSPRRPPASTNSSRLSWSSHCRRTTRWRTSAGRWPRAH